MNNPVVDIAPDFAAHVALIMDQDGLNEEPAKFLAWCEGPQGYLQRQMGRKKRGGGKAMIWRSIHLNHCHICGRDVARVLATAGGFAVACDAESGGCGAGSVAGASEALAIENWNNAPRPAAAALMAAHDRRASEVLP